MLDASCAVMPSLSPRRRVPTSRPAFVGTCCLRPTVAGSASKASHFRGHQCVRLRYGLTACCPRFRVAFRASFNRSVSLTIVALLRGSGYCPGGSVSHWTHLPFLDTQPDKPFSGRLMLRLSPELHRKVFVRAQHEGKSLNQWISDRLDRTS